MNVNNDHSSNVLSSGSPIQDEEDMLSQPLMPELENHQVHHGGGVESHGSVGCLKFGGFPASLFSLCSVSLGVGVFVLPFALSGLGFIAGSFCFFLIAVWSYASNMALHLAGIVVMCDLGKAYVSFQDIARHAFGFVGESVLSFFLALTLLVGNSAHVKTVVGLLHDILEWYVTGTYGKMELSSGRETVLLLGILLVAFPLCGSRTLGALRYVSTMSVSVVLIACIWCIGECMFWYWPHGDFEAGRIPMISSSWKDYATYIPAIAFTFSGTLVLMPVLSDYEKKDSKSVSNLIGVSTLICLVGYFAFSLVVVLTFGDRVNYDSWAGSKASTVLYVFPPDHYGVTFLCFCLCVVITLLYPILNFPAINAVETMLKIAGTNPDSWRISYRMRRLSLSFLFMVVVFFLNVSDSSILDLFGLCGSWGVGMVCYVLPLLFYLKLCPEESTLRKVAALFGVFGMVVVIVGYTVSSFQK